MKKCKNLLIAVLILVLMISNMSSAFVAKADETEAIKASLVLGESLKPFSVSPGETLSLSIPVKALNAYIRSPYFSIKTDELPLYVSSDITMSRPGYADNSILGIDQYDKTYLNFEIVIDETAKEGNYNMYLDCLAVDAQYQSYNIQLASPIIIKVTSTKSAPALSAANVSYPKELQSGEEFNLTFNLTNSGDITAKSVSVTVDGFEADGIMPNYSNAKTNLGELAKNDSKKVNLPMTTSESATSGVKKLNIIVKYTDSKGTEYADETIPLYIEMQRSEEDIEKAEDPNVIISNVKQSKSAPKAGEKVTVSFYVNNKSKKDIKQIKLVPTNLTNANFSPTSSEPYQYIETVEAGKKKQVKMEFVISKDIPSGLNEITMDYSYKDSDGKAYGPTSVKLFVRDVVNPTQKEEDPNIVITDVNQSVNTPLAGGKVTMSFYIENKSNKNVKQIKLTPTNLTKDNFSPTSSKPYQYIDSIGAGKRKLVTMGFNVSKEIPNGLNEIALEYTYKDSDGKTYGPTTVKLFVLNVLNPEKEEDKLGTPKLIISDYSTSEEVLKAGSVFTFKFDIKNTHQVTSAKNIKVTLSSEENVFSVTKGSNSFYIEAIKPQEISENSIELKIKADSTTKAYPLKIKFEYEYEGMPIVENVATPGQTVEEPITLNVTENARPSATNIMVGSWETPTVNMPTTLSFEFRNMGKAVLSNVQAKIESDAFSSSSPVLWIGNVEAGMGDLQEMEVTPLMEGMGKGTLIIMYEDTNGDVIEVPYEFEGTVQADMGMMPEGEFPIMPEIPEPKAPILPTWAFIMIQVVVFILAIPIARKVTLAIYKKRLLKKEESEF